MSTNKYEILNQERKIQKMKKKVADFVDMEQRSGSMQLMTSEYVARCMQISLEDVTEVLKALKK